MMQPIILGIDFSNTSIHALEYAIGLANKMKSDILMVWVDKITVQEYVNSELPPESKNEIKRRFDELIAHYKPMLSKGLTLDYRLRKGKIFREIDNLAKSMNAGLIIAGTHGTSGYEEYWIGSNAYQLVTFTELPVITVRHDFELGHDIERILVPITSSNDTIQKVPRAALIAKLYNAEIHLIAMHNNTLKTIQRITNKFAGMAAEYLRKNEVRFVEDSISCTDITKCLLTYAINMKADLITIMAEQENPVNIHLTARSQQVISQAHVPVLSITASEKFKLE